MINVNVVWMPAFVHSMIQERVRFMTKFRYGDSYIFMQN
jgi:hypothetical protein